MDPPQLAIPVAKPRRILKWWPMDPMQGVDTKEVPRPPKIENTSIKCQYALLKCQCSIKYDDVREADAIRETDPYKLRAKVCMLQDICYPQSSKP